MYKLYQNWKHGVDFFYATKFSHWTKLDHLKKDFIFNSKTIWLIRYLVSAPLLLGPFLIVYFMLDQLLEGARNGVDPIADVRVIIIVGTLITFIVYPTLMFIVCLRLGVIRRKHN